MALSEKQLLQWLSCSLDKRDLPVMMIDGIYFRGRVILVALCIDVQSNTHVLRLREGCTDSARVARSLLSDLIERARLWVIDGGKALRRAIGECFGATALVQRCQQHKRRNVLEHLPEQLHASVGRVLRNAWRRHQRQVGRHAAAAPSASLQSRHPAAAACPREGLDETLTFQTMGIAGAPYQTLRTTILIENRSTARLRTTRATSHAGATHR